MKVAILTFQDAQNYGAVLQAFALKRKCLEYVETDVINYYNPFFHEEEKNTDLKALIKKIMNYKKIQRKKSKFEHFMNQYIVQNQRKVLKDELVGLDEQYDVFITGSDQVWNLECSGNDKSYFLDFITKSSKNSYAASFGSLRKVDNNYMKDLLSGFKNISVREESGKEIIKSVLNRDALVVLDPTFLLKKNDWQRAFNLQFAEQYVLVYEVLAGDQLFEQAKKFAQDKKLNLICITSTDKPRVGAKVVKDAGPEEWLQYFSRAAYIFTNSFHGLAFSLNFQKQFFVELLPPPAKTNTRILEMLKCVRVERDSSKANELPDIDYSKVEQVLNNERQNSVEYLKSIFE